MEYPTLSIVVPTRSRPLQLNNCLESIVQLDYPKDRLEVIVVDDAGSPPAAQVVPRFAERISVSLMLQEKAGPASARNTGAFRAKGDLLAFVDDDCLLTMDWAKQMAAFHLQNPEHAVGGLTVNSLHCNPYSAASQTLIDYLYSYYNSKNGNARFLTSNNVAFPTDQFRRVGGFDTRFKRAAAEDRDLCDRWLHHGYQMTYAPGALVRHAHDLNILSFWNQHFRYGSGAVGYHKLRAMRNQERVRLEPLTFYLGLLRYPFRSLPAHKAFLQSALLAVAQVANAAGFFWTFFTTQHSKVVAMEVFLDQKSVAASESKISR